MIRTLLNNNALFLLALMVTFLVTFFMTASVAEAYELRGRVLDYKGAPVEDAQIWVSRDQQVYRATSDANGEFRIENIDKGYVRVVAMESDHSLGGKEGQLLGDNIFTIALDKAKDMPIRILNSDFEPIVGARLKSLFVDDTFTVDVELLSQHGFRSIRSDDDGVMMLPNIPRFVRVGMVTTHPDYADGVLPTFPIGRDIPMVMVPGVKLRGRVTEESGQGIEGARVVVGIIKGNKSNRYTEVFTGPDGFYTVTVPPAQYVIAARHVDFAIGQPTVVRIRAGSVEALANVQLLTPRHISGQALLESGEPVALVRVGFRNSTGAIVADSYTGQDGQFSITVPKGLGSLVVTPPHGLMTVLYHEFNVGDTIDAIDDILIRPMPAISGTVQDSEGAPVANALVRTIGADPPLYTQSDEDGQFRMQLDNVRGIGTVQLYAEHPLRFLRAKKEIDLRNPRPEELELKSFRPRLEFIPELSANNLSDLLNEPAPEWECTDWFNLPAGQDSVSLADLKGKIVVLTLWAGFDLGGKTRQRFQELEYLYGIFGEEDDVEFITIHDTMLNPPQIELIVKSWGIQFPVGCDAESFASFNSYRVLQIPQTVLIDKEGILKYYEVEDRLHTLIKAMRRKR